jgi:hypothetical protein
LGDEYGNYGRILDALMAKWLNSHANYIKMLIQVSLQPCISLNNSEITFLKHRLDCGIVGCDTVTSAGGCQRFGGTYHLRLQGGSEGRDSEYDILKMGAVDSSETIVTTYETTRYRNPEGDNLYAHRRENLKSHR